MGIIRSIVTTGMMIGAFYLGQSDTVHRAKTYWRHHNTTIDSTSYQYPSRLELAVEKNQVKVRDWMTNKEYILPPTLAPLPCPVVEPCPDKTRCYLLCDKLGMGSKTAKATTGSTTTTANSSEESKATPPDWLQQWLE